MVIAGVDAACGSGRCVSVQAMVRRQVCGVRYLMPGRFTEKEWSGDMNEEKLTQELNAMIRSEWMKLVVENDYAMIRSVVESTQSPTWNDINDNEKALMISTVLMRFILDYGR